MVDVKGLETAATLSHWRLVFSYDSLLFILDRVCLTLKLAYVIDRGIITMGVGL